MTQRFFLEEFQWSTVDAHDDDDEIIKFQVRCLGVYFEIQYRPHNLSLSPNLLEQHCSSLSIMRACEVGDNRDAEKALQEIHRLKKPFEELMAELAPNPPPSHNRLSDYLYPPLLILEAKAPAQDRVIIQPYLKGELPRQMRWPGGRYISTWGDWLRSMRCFTSNQIQLISTSSDPEKHPCIRGPTKVIAGDGTVCYYKDLPPWASAVSKVAKGEQWVHMQIPAAIKAKKLRSDIRICRLHGLVVDDDRTVLQHWFCATEEELLSKWNNDGKDDWTPEQYANQDFGMKRLVGMLIHYIENKGLVWGDAKPSNILVDQDDRLWLVDLEGGYTLGWVDEANRDSQKGDSQGVKRIKEWLAKCGEKPLDRVVPRSH